MADAKVHASVADLVTKLHTNIDSIHATLSSLTTTSSAHHAELERLSLEREQKIAELRASHENALKELAAQREKDGEALAEQRRKEQEELESERQREYEELMAKRKQEDEARENALQAKEAERVKALQEEDAKREAEKDEMERSLQEKVEQELELLEDEMERKVEEGRQALRDLDEKRKAINAEIDAALNGPSVIPPIFFRSRSKTLKGLTNGTNGSHSPAPESVVSDIQTIPESEIEKETENVETPPSDGLSVVNGSRDIHIEEEGAPASIPEVLETEDIKPSSTIPLPEHIDTSEALKTEDVELSSAVSAPDHIDASETDRELPNSEDTIPEPRVDSSETNGLSDEDKQTPIEAALEHTKILASENSEEEAAALAPTELEVKDSSMSEAETSRELPEELTDNVEKASEIEDESSLTEPEQELVVSRDEPVHDFEDSLPIDEVSDDKPNGDDEAAVLSKDIQSTPELKPTVDNEEIPEMSHHQEIAALPDTVVEAGVQEPEDIPTPSEHHHIGSGIDTDLAVSDAQGVDHTPEHIIDSHDDILDSADVVEEPSVIEEISESRDLPLELEHATVESEVEDKSIPAELEHSAIELKSEDNSIPDELEHSTIESEADDKSVPAELEHSTIESEAEEQVSLVEASHVHPDLEKAGDITEIIKEISSEPAANESEHSDLDESTPSGPEDQVLSVVEKHMDLTPESRDLDTLEASLKLDPSAQEDSNIDQDKDLPSSESQETESEHLAHDQSEDLTDSQIEEAVENTSKELGMPEDPLEKSEVDYDHSVLSEDQDKSLDRADVLGDEGPTVARDLPTEVERVEDEDDTIPTHIVSVIDETFDPEIDILQRTSTGADAANSETHEQPDTELEATPVSESEEHLSTANQPETKADELEKDKEIDEDHPSKQEPVLATSDVSRDVIGHDDNDGIESLPEEVASESIHNNENQTVGSHEVVDKEESLQEDDHTAHVLETPSEPVIETHSNDINLVEEESELPQHLDTMDLSEEQITEDLPSSLMPSNEDISSSGDKTDGTIPESVSESQGELDTRQISSIDEDLKSYDSATEDISSAQITGHHSLHEDDTRDNSTDDEFESALSDGGSVSPQYEPSSEEHLPQQMETLSNSDPSDKAHTVPQSIAVTGEDINDDLDVETLDEQHSHELPIVPSNIDTLEQDDIEINPDSDLPKERSIDIDSPVLGTPSGSLAELHPEVAKNQADRESVDNAEDSEDSTPRLESFSARSIAHIESEDDLLENSPIEAAGPHPVQEPATESEDATHSLEEISETVASHHQVTDEALIDRDQIHEGLPEDKLVLDTLELKPDTLTYGETMHEESKPLEAAKSGETVDSSEVLSQYDSTEKQSEVSIPATTTLETFESPEAKSKDISDNDIIRKDDDETLKSEEQPIMHDDSTVALTEQSRDVDLPAEVPEIKETVHSAETSKDQDILPSEHVAIDDDVPKAGTADIDGHQEGVRLSAPSSRETLAPSPSSLEDKTSTVAESTIGELQAENTHLSSSKDVDVFKFLEPEETEAPETEAAYDTMDEGSLKDGAPLNGSTGPLDHSVDQERTLDSDPRQAVVVESHANRFAESPVTVLHTDDETETDTDSDTSEISEEEEESGADAEDEEEDSEEEDGETYDSDGSQEEDSDGPAPVPMPSKVERNFPHVIQAMPSYEFGKPKMVDPFSEGSHDQIDFSSSHRSSGLFASLVDTIKSDLPIVKQMGSNGGSRSPHQEDDYPPAVEVTEAMRAKKLVQNAFQQTDTEDDVPFHDSFSDHQPNNMHSRSHTADTVPSFESHAQSDAESTASETPSSPFQENPPAEPLIASSGPVHEEISEETRDLKVDELPLRAEFDPYGSNTYPKYITSKKSQADLKSPVKSPRSPRNDRFVSQSIISPKSQYSPRGTPSPTSRRFSQSTTTGSRPFSPEARPLSYQEKRLSQDPLPAPTLKRAMTDQKVQTPRPPFASPSVPPVPANSFFQKTRSLFEATSAQASQALPTVTRPLSGYFNGRGSPSPSPSPKLQKKGSMASLRSRPSSLYQSELTVSEEDLVPRSLDGDGKPPSPAFTIPTAASVARSNSISSQRKSSHGSISKVENDLNVWTPSKDIKPRNSNPLSGIGKGYGERERVPLLAGERDGDGGVGVER